MIGFPRDGNPPWLTPDRRLFDGAVQPKVLAFQESTGLDAAAIAHALNSPINKEDVPKQSLFEEIDEEERGLFSKKALAEKGHVSQADIASLVELFEDAKTFGSLIQIPPKLAAKLVEIEKRLDGVLKFGDLTHVSAHVLKPLLQQAWLLGSHYDAVVANPPYMGSKYLTPRLKTFVGDQYDASKGDTYSCFISRNLCFAKHGGSIGMITLQNWMFLPTWVELREHLLSETTITSLIHNGRGVWGSDFPSCEFILQRIHLPDYRGTYRRLYTQTGEVSTNEELQERFFTSGNFVVPASSLRSIDGNPIAYWLSVPSRQRAQCRNSSFVGRIRS